MRYRDVRNHGRAAENDAGADRGGAELRIAFFVNSFPEISETFILNQITGLYRLGYPVDILTRRSSDQDRFHPDVERFRLLERVIVCGHGSPLMPKGRLRRIVRAAAVLFGGGKGNLLPLLRSLNIFRYGLLALSLNLFYRTYIVGSLKRSYDIVYCHFGENGVAAAQLMDVGVMSGKLVVAFHGYDMSNYLRKHGTRVYDRLFRRGDLFLPISDFWKEKLIAIGCPPGKIRVHRMGIDLSRFTFSPRFPNMTKRIRLLSIARLVEKKGLQYAVEAVALLLERRFDVHYTIAGDGPLRSELLSQIERLGLSGRVRLLGWRTQSEIVSLMQQTDILLCPSVTDQEGSQEGIPVTLMEALAQGLPVISTRHSGIPELVRHEHSGLLVPEADAVGLAEALERLTGNPELYLQMAKNGREHVEFHYDVEHLNRQLVESFLTLMETGRRAPVKPP